MTEPQGSVALAERLPDAIDTSLAVDLVVWSGIGLLLVLGYAGGRLGGAAHRGA